MAEFVKQRARVIIGQQRRLALRGLGEIADVDDDRPLLAAELALARANYQRAADLARLGALAFAAGAAVAPELAEPAYLRNNVAVTLAEQAAARAARG